MVVIVDVVVVAIVDVDTVGMVSIDVDISDSGEVFSEVEISLQYSCIYKVIIDQILEKVNSDYE